MQYELAVKYGEEANVVQWDIHASEAELSRSREVWVTKQLQQQKPMGGRTGCFAWLQAFFG